MTQEMLSTGTTQDIADFIKQCRFLDDPFLLVEQSPRQAVSDDKRQGLLRFARLSDGLDFARLDDDVKIAPFTAGRVFSRAFELRWEQDAEATRVIYLGAQRELPTLQQLRQDTFELVDKKRYYLFGTRLDEQDLATMRITQDRDDYPYYAEVRIPRLLRYPIARRAQQVKLVVGEYRNQQQERLFRFLNLISAEEKEEEEEEA